MVVVATRSRRFNFLVMLMMALTVSEKYWGKDSLSARIDNGRKRKLQYTR